MPRRLFCRWCWCSIAWLLLGLAPLPALAQARIVTIAVDDAHLPYSYAVDKQPAGIYVQVLGLAMRDLPGWQVQLVARPWARALKESREGLVDGFMPPYQEVDRNWVAAYAGPLYVEEVVISCAPQVRAGPGSRWPEDFSRLRMGTTRGYLLGYQMSDAFRRGLMSHHEFRDARDALAALALGQIDCYANDLLDIEHSYQLALTDKLWSERMPKRLEPHFVLSSQKAYVGFSAASMAKRPELAAFVQALDVQLGRLRASGEIKRLVDEARAGGR